MKHAIDPTVDCVFKALLGSEANQNLLVHFLNAVLLPSTHTPVSSVEIINPYNEKEFVTDKLSIVDIKARDQSSHLYQVEIQLCTHPGLPERILYTWADLYSKQIQDGENYRKLQPTYSIWLLNNALIAKDPAYLHHFQMQDEHNQPLLHSGGIFLLELSKFKTDKVHSELERWLTLFKQGRQLDDQQLPEWMQTNEMRQVMTTLKRFSEKEKTYHFYQARQEYLRRERAIQEGIAESRIELERMRQEKAQLILLQQEAAQKAQKATQQAQEAKQQAQEAKQQAQEAEQQAQEAEQQAQEAEQQAQEAIQQSMQRERLVSTERDEALEEKKAATLEIEHLKALLAQKNQS